MSRQWPLVPQIPACEADYMSQPGTDAVLDRLKEQVEAYHAAALTYAAVKLELPETMGKEGWVAARLAKEIGVSAPHLERMLKGLIALDLAEKRDNGTYALTEAGRALAPGSASTLREKLLIVVEQYWPPWAALATCVKTGVPAFTSVFGMSVGDWRREHPHAGAMFETYLDRETAAQIPVLVAVLDLSGVKTVAEIGGGHGALLAALLQSHPNLSGVLMDEPHKLAGARNYLRSHDLVGRVAFAGGNATEAVPVVADLYVLKTVLQMHDEARAQAILVNCRQAMPEGARLVLIERLMSEDRGDRTQDPGTVMLDLHMMAITGGKIRTLAEVKALLKETGLSIARTEPTPTGLTLITCAQL